MRRIGCSARFAVAFLVGMLWNLPGRAAPDLLTYDFDANNSSPLSIRIVATAAFAGSPTSASNTRIEIGLPSWSLSQLVILSEDRRSATFASPSQLAMSGAPVSASGQFDLGFSGVIPYSITVSALSASLLGGPATLKADASFANVFAQVSTIRIEGVIELLGSTIPYGLTVSPANPGIGYSGAFTPSADPASIGISYGAGGSFPVELYQGSSGGFDLQLGGLIDLPGQYNDDQPTVVPEPRTALLLGLGLAALTARRKSSARR